MAKGGTSGVLKWFNVTRGYGFLAVNGSKDVFIHKDALKKSGITDDLVEGEPLTFEIETSAKGLKAINISRA